MGYYAGRLRSGGFSYLYTSGTLGCGAARAQFHEVAHEIVCAGQLHLLFDTVAHFLISSVAGAIYAREFLVGHARLEQAAGPDLQRCEVRV